VIEDLNVSGMLKNHRLASAIADCGFYEFRRQLEYKSDWYGAILHIVDRWKPSSKTCSNCHEIKTDLKLKERVFNCSHCGLKIDRDFNASLNLENAVSSTV
jgi:putative transposase